MYHLVEALAVWPDADDMRQSPIYHFGWDQFLDAGSISVSDSLTQLHESGLLMG